MATILGAGAASRNFKSILGPKDECCAEIDQAEALWILKPLSIESRLVEMDTDDTQSISCAEMIEEITQFTHFVYQRTNLALEQMFIEEKIQDFKEKQRNATMKEIMDLINEKEMNSTTTVLNE